MRIIPLLKENYEKAAALFNNVAEGETPYRKLNIQQFTESFVENSDKVLKCALVAEDFGRIYGFASGCVKKDGDIGYITFIVVDSSMRRKNVGHALLAALEKGLKELAPIEKFEITFFNPVNLTWIVPGTACHDHPNAPGVDVRSDAYVFYKNEGYIDTAYQNSFYLQLKKYQMADAVKEKISGLKEHELSVCLYDSTKHHGMEELFDDLGSPLWKEEIMGIISKPNHEPVIIAEHNGKAVGFTGPIHTQESGRGYFTGIGVHSEYRKYGLGKALFNMLCQTHKDIGSEFMTLFTGETNPARRMYQGAGFKIVKSWTDMAKEIKK